MGQNEELFNEKLKDIFIGEEIKGKSGHANLMRIKSNYFDEVFQQLNEDIDERVSRFDGEEDFREELYSKLYTFMKKYFSDSGSIYFTYTPLNEKTYEEVYDNNEDVTLFWKTHMLYYVKTDTIWNELEIENKELDGEEYDIHFDVSEMEGKDANEKKKIKVFLEEVEDGRIELSVRYHNHGMSDTAIDDIRKGLKKEDIKISNEEVRDIVGTFRKQNEVDFFINKDAEGFLKEQFDMWLKQYVLDEKSVFKEDRLKEIKAIRETAYDIIDFVSQFEEELKKVWNKPKFALDSNYVVSLDKIVEKEGGWDVFDELKDHEGWKDQVEEWQELGFTDEESLQIEPNQAQLNGRKLNEEHRHLPIDTKHFELMKTEILSLFNNLDAELDGRLIRSENYQALMTLLPKLQNQIKSVYIDPPFNKEQEAEYDYRVKYKDSSWITLLENRISVAKELMSEEASIFARCDYNGNKYLSNLLDQIFGKENFRNEIALKRGNEKSGLYSQYDGLKSLGVTYDSLYWYTVNSDIRFSDVEVKMDEPREAYWKEPKKVEDRPTMQYELLGETPEPNRWMWKQERAERAVENYKQYEEESEEGESLKEYWERTGKEKDFIKKDENGKVVYWVEPKEYETLDNRWTDISGYANSSRFQTENSEELLRRVVQITSDEGDTVMDFFLGSGTTTAVAHKMGREWIGIELGEHFYDVALPRMKQVVKYDPSDISEDEEIQEKYSRDSAGGFFKYYELEQYEQALKKCTYEDSKPFDFQSEKIYNEYAFLNDDKMLDVVDVDREDEEVDIDLTEIYPNVDIAETLSNVKGKKIKQIKENSVEFVDGEVVEFDKIEFKDVKPLIWWD